MLVSINCINSIIFILSWGLGIGDWGLGIGPNPQSPIPKIFSFLNTKTSNNFLNIKHNKFN